MIQKDIVNQAYLAGTSLISLTGFLASLIIAITINSVVLGFLLPWLAASAVISAYAYEKSYKKLEQNSPQNKD